MSYDDQFDISEPEAQQFLYDLCQSLPSEKEIVVQDDEVVDCWIETFKYFVEATYGPDSFPVP